MTQAQKTALIEEITQTTLNTLGAVTIMLQNSLDAINRIVDEPSEPVATTSLPELMTPDQAMAFLQISRGTLATKTKNREIPFVMLGNHTYRYRRSELIEYTTRQAYLSDHQLRQKYDT